MHNYVIETERLILRPLKINDAEVVYQWEYILRKSCGVAYHASKPR